MDKRIEKCRAWAGEVLKQTKSSTVMQKADGNPKLVLYTAMLLALTSWLLVRIVKYLKKPSYSSRPSTPDLEKPAARSFKAPLRKPGGLCN